MPLQASPKPVRYWFQPVKAFTSFDYLDKGVIELLFEYCTENLWKQLYLLEDPLELLEPLTHNIEGMHSSQTLFMSVIMSVRISCQIGYRPTLGRVFKGCGFQHWMLIEWTYKTFLFVQFRTSKVYLKKYLSQALCSLVRAFSGLLQPQ